MTELLCIDKADPKKHQKAVGPDPSMPTSQRDDRDPPSPPAAAMSADGVITGRRPYRFLDETSAWNGAVRLSAFVVLPLLCLVGGILMISYETGWANHEDRDSRDMAWDYRVTAPGSNNFHSAYFRRAHWNTFRAIEAPATVYTEVVLAAAFVAGAGALTVDSLNNL